MVRIFYLIPDAAKKFSFRKFIRSVLGLDPSYIGRLLRGSDQISGGVKVIFQHCEFLNSVGFWARPLLLGESKITWFESSVCPLTTQDIGYDLNEEDIIVCPQVIPYEGLKFKNAKKILFAQGWWVWKTALLPEDLKKTYFELGYDGFITNTRYNADYLQKHGRGKVTATITMGIDQTKFTYKPELKEEGRILWLPRKNPADGKKIVTEVKKKAPSAKFVKADNLTEEQIIAEYQKADIFLATGYPEGFSMPPAEAMLCGCAVVGFTGGAAREFMIDGKTALVSEDGDTEDAARKLIKLLRNKKLKEYIRKKAHEKSKEYSMERMKQSLKVFYEEFV